jgi:hypothetical protein
VLIIVHLCELIIREGLRFLLPVLFAHVVTQGLCNGHFRAHCLSPDLVTTAVVCSPSPSWPSRNRDA